MRQAYIQDRLLCSSCAVISSIYSAEQACRNSTFLCSIHDFPYNKLNKKSLLQAAATIQERLMCRHAVAKVRLLFESGFYSRAGFTQDFTVVVLYVGCSVHHVLFEVSCVVYSEQVGGRSSFFGYYLVSMFRHCLWVFCTLLFLTAEIMILVKTLGNC